MASTEDRTALTSGMAWTGLAILVALWWSLGELDLVPFSWRMTAPLAILALGISLYASLR